MGMNLPEFLRLPSMVLKFTFTGITLPMLRKIFSSEVIKPRNFVEDMKIFYKSQPVNISGIENIPTNGGGLIIINHPDLSIIFPGICKLPVEAKARLGRDDMSLLVGLRFTLFNIDLPGTAHAIKRFFQFYPRNLIFVPGNEKDPDYGSDRQKVKDEIFQKLQNGHLIVLSPEATISATGSILPTSIYRYGAGEIGIYSQTINIPIIPAAIWLENNLVNVKAGKQFFLPDGITAKEAVIHMMGQVAKQIPNRFRGPYRFPAN